MTLGEPGEGEGEGCMFTPCVPGTCPMHDCPLLIVLLVSEEVSLDYKWPCWRDFHNQPPSTFATDVSHYSSCCVPHVSVVYLNKHICGLRLFSDEGSSRRLPKLSDLIK